MRRRDFIRSSMAVAIAGVQAGCTTHHLQEAERSPPLFEPIPVEEIDLPVEQRLDVAAAGIERARDVAIPTIEAFEAYLDEQSIHVDSLTDTVVAGIPILELAYGSTETPESGLMRQLGIVAGGYAALVAASHESEQLDVRLHDRAGEEFGEYEVRRDWAEWHVAGVYSAKKYASEIAVTVATV